MYREMNSRATSVTGFIQLLKAAKGTPTTPQKPSKNGGKSSRGVLPDSVCFEILGIFSSYLCFSFFSLRSFLIFNTGFLRRSLTQQAEVRGKLYEGLCELLKCSPSLKDTVADVLLPQVIPIPLLSISSPFPPFFSRPPQFRWN